MAIAQTMDLHTYIESLPSIIGHVPVASLIISGFGENCRSAGVARIDLPKTVEDIGTHCEALARDIQDISRTQEWKRVLLVAWCEGEDELVAHAMMPLAVSAMRNAGRGILGEFIVASDTIEGTAYDRDGHAQAHTYTRAPHLGDQMRHDLGLAGGPLLPSREAVAEQVAYDGSRVDVTRAPLSEADHLDLWHHVINTGERDVSTLCGEEVAQIVLGLLDTQLRDAILGSFMFTTTDDVRPTGDIGQIVQSWDSTGTHLEVTERLRLLARRTPDGRPAAHLLVILALRAYVAGRTALANVALERATTIQPDHSMAQLVDMMIRNGIKLPG